MSELYICLWAILRQKEASLYSNARSPLLPELLIWDLKMHIAELQHNELSAAEDGKCFLWFHLSSNPCFDCNLKDAASIPMISLVLDPYFVAARKSGLPSGAGLVCEIPLSTIEGSRREIERDDKDKIKLHFVLIVWLLVGERPLPEHRPSCWRGMNVDAVSTDRKRSFNRHLMQEEARAAVTAATRQLEEASKCRKRMEVGDGS